MHSILDSIFVASPTSEFLSDVIRGLSAPSPWLPSKYFYDQRGSILFDQICELEEYYPTRVESHLMERSAQQMAACLGSNIRLIEYGSGSSGKTRMLLDNLIEPLDYVPVDISGEHLLRTAARLRAEYPLLNVAPVIADFTATFDLPPAAFGTSRTCIYFPGSTIGNFTLAEATRLLASMAVVCGDEGGLLIGFDLQKKIPILEAAYNDRQGVTAEFNKNLLHRINRELRGNFDVDRFEHHAYYDSTANRIEMRLISQYDQAVSIAGRRFSFDAGTAIRTEYSHKYTVDGFAKTAAKVGWRCEEFWTDPEEFFAVMYLESQSVR